MNNAVLTSSVVGKYSGKINKTVLTYSIVVALSLLTLLNLFHESYLFKWLNIEADSASSYYNNEVENMEQSLKSNIESLNYNTRPNAIDMCWNNSNLAKPAILSKEKVSDKLQHSFNIIDMCWGNRNLTSDLAKPAILSKNTASGQLQHSFNAIDMCRGYSRAV